MIGNFLLHCIFLYIIFENGVAEFGSVQKRPCGKLNHTTNVGHIQPRNATISEGSQCSWIIEPKGPGAKEIFLIVEEFFMNSDDSFTVTDLTTKKTIFPPFHGKIGPFSLLSGTLDLNVLLQASKSTFPPRKFQADYASNCSYTIKPPASSGILVSPLYATGRTDLVTCTWNLKPFENTEKLYLVFQSFSLSGSKLSISGSDNQDGEYSVSTPPDILASGHLVLTFQLDTSKPNQQFRAIYEPVSQMCSQFIKLDKDHTGVNLASPSAEDVYEAKYGTLHCQWIVMGVNGSTLQLKFQNLHLTGSLDYLAINDGGSMLSPVLGQIGVLNQNSSLGQVFTSSGNYMWIAFSSPFLQMNVGFAAEVTMLSSAHQNIISPSHQDYIFDKELLTDDPHHCIPNTININDLTKGTCGLSKQNKESGHLWPKGCKLKGNKQCTYNISSPDEKEIFLIIDQFFMFGSDIMQISPLNESESLLFGPYKGIKESFSIITGRSEIQVFVSTSRNSGTRIFSARFNSSCYDDNGQFLDLQKSGRITSPIYSTSANDVNCVWNLNAPDSSYVISVEFSKFNISGNSTLEIKSEDVTYAGNSFSGVVGVNSVALKLDRSIPDQIVEFHYKSSSKICSENIALNKDSQTRIINLPSYEEMSASGLTSLNCLWIISSSPDTVIGINVTDFSLFDHFDEFVVNDGSNYLSKVLWSAVPGHEDIVKAHYLRTSKNEASLSFITSFLQFGATFSVTVTMYEQGGYQTESGNLQVHPPVHDDEVVFLLEVNPSEQVMLSVEEICSSCNIFLYKDYSNLALIRRLEGTISPYPVFSPTSKMMVVIKNVSDSIFRASFKGVSQGCNKITTDSSDSYILSGNCSMACSWTINPQTKYKNGILVLHVSFFTLEHTLSLEIYYINDNMTKIASLSPSDNNIPPIYLSASSGVYIQIIRDSCQESEQSTVVFANVVTLPDCSSSISIAPPKTVQVFSPDFPNFYPWLAKCWWNITTTNALYLTFDHLQFAPGHCLKVYKKDKNANLVTLVATFNDQNKSFDDILLKSSIGINFLSTSCDGGNNTAVISGRGFAINVSAIDCGDSVINANGSFSSPGFPQPVTQSILCRWIISVPAVDENNTINIINFKISWGKDGMEDENLKVYDGPSLHYPELVISNSTASLLSRMNTMVFVYKYNQSQVHAPGFSVSYESHACSKLCHNGICMHDDWVCNGINDCGDFSDEKKCNLLGNNGVPVWAMSLSIPFTFLIGGLLGAIFIPYLKRRYRTTQQGRYTSVAVINEVDDE